MPDGIFSCVMSFRKYIIILCALLAAACSSRRGRFRVEGHFLHINQGQLLVYSTDGALGGVDTIKVSGGRFAYEIPCGKPGTLMFVFPNYSVHPVFAEPGGSVDINADASHLKEMEVTGTKQNELMTDFRMQTAQMSPPEIVRQAELFVGDHPESLVAEYLLRRYLVVTDKPEYDKALQLLGKMMAKQPDNGRLVRLKNDIRLMRNTMTGMAMPSFSAQATDGRRVGGSELRGHVTVIVACAAWQYDSVDQLRQLERKMKEQGSDFKVVAVCIDADSKQLEREMGDGTMPWPVVCDGKMFEGRLVAQLGLYTVPGNIIFNKQGRVVERNLDTQELLKRIDEIK